MVRRDQAWENRAGGYIETTNPLGYDVLINGTDKYLNFNLISGSLGYGFRDNAGVMEFKNSAGAWANFGAGGGSVTIGTPVVGGNPGRILYIDQSGNLFGDDAAVRDSGVQKQTTIGSGTYAQANANDGVSAEVYFQADVIGDTGNSISLVFDGIDDADTVLNAWNTANPGNTASIVDGVGTTVPTAGTRPFIGGGEIIYESGTVNNGASTFFQGSGSTLLDTTNGKIGFSTTGNLISVIQEPSLGFVAAGIDFNTGNLGAMVVSDSGINFFVTDQSTYNARLQGDDVEIILAYNGTYLGVNGLSGPLWGDSSSNRYILPTNVTPSVGDTLAVASISGSDYALDFVTPGGGGNTFTAELGQDLTAYAGNIVALTLDAGSPDYQASPLFKETTQSSAATGIGPSQLFVKSLKLNQKDNFIISQSSTAINIQAMYYDVLTGTWAGSWTGTTISDAISTTKPFDCCKIDNSHFVIGYIDTSDNLIFATYRVTNVGLELVEAYAVNAAQTYDSIRLVQSGGGVQELYRYTNVSYFAERTDTGFIERGNITYHADFSIESIAASTTTIAVGANSVNFQVHGLDYQQSTVVLYCEPVTGDYAIIDSAGAIVCSNTGGGFAVGTSLSIVGLHYLNPSNIAWTVCWNNNIYNTIIGTIIYDVPGVTVNMLGSTTQVFGVDASVDTSFYSASITRFVNETTSNGSQPRYLFAQRVVNTVDVELVAITVDYSTPTLPAYTVGTVETLTIANYDDTIGVISANNWRYENLTSRDKHILSLDYISTSAGATPQRLIHVFDEDSTAWTNKTWRKADFSKARCLFIPDGSSTVGATVTVYGPGATIPVSGSNSIVYVGSDGLNTSLNITDVIAYEQISPTEGLVLLTPYVPKELDGYPGSAYPSEGYSLYKLYTNANSISPAITETGYLTNDIKVINMVAFANQAFYASNVNNTGITLDTANGPGYLSNIYDYMIIKPRIDFCDGGFDIIEDGRTRFWKTFDMSDTTYFDTDTLYLPYFWNTYGQVELTNTTGTAIEFIVTDGNIGSDQRLFIQPDDNSVDIVQTSVATPTAACIIGLNTTTTLSAHAATYYGDWMELDFKNNAWHKYNIEIYT